MDYHNFLFFLGKTVNPLVLKTQEVYLDSVPRASREQYQFGKMLEEIGEFMQALHANRVGPVNVGDDLEKCNAIRGTIPSEAADVVLSAMSLMIIKKFSVTRCKDYNIDVDDIELVTNELHRAVMYEEGSRAISVLYRYCKKMNYDLADHVLARAAFNLHEVEAHLG